MFDGVVFLAGARYDVDRDAAAMIKVGMTSNAVGFIEEKLHMRVPEARHAFGVHVQYVSHQHAPRGALTFLQERGHEPSCE